MRNLTPQGLLLLFLLSSTTVFAQSKITTINSEEIGTLNVSYLKLEHEASQKTDYAVYVIYKNQNYIYKQESDTIRLKSQQQLNQLISDFKAGLLLIDDETKGNSFTGHGYTLEKNIGYSENKFLAFLNKEKAIKTTLNKYFVNQLIDWLTAVPFGKG
jgi:Ca2+-dependent lipid-binding protein